MYGKVFAQHNTKGIATNNNKHSKNTRNKMRKELIVYVNMREKGQEISVTSLAADRKYVIINTGNGKVVVDVQELKDAVTALEDFQKDKGEENLVLPEIPVNNFEVTYGDE